MTFLLHFLYLLDFTYICVYNRGIKSKGDATMKTTMKSINSALERRTYYTNRYMVPGFTGYLEHSQQNISAIYADVDEQTGRVTGIYDYAVGDGMPHRHYYAKSCVEISDAIVSWMRGDIDRAGCVEEIRDAVNAWLDDRDGAPRSPIAAARIAKGFSQARLAEAMGVTQQQVAAWERGIRKPKLQNLRILGAVLDVDWETLSE